MEVPVGGSEPACDETCTILIEREKVNEWQMVVHRQDVEVVCKRASMKLELLTNEWTIGCEVARRWQVGVKTRRSMFFL